MVLIILILHECYCSNSAKSPFPHRLVPATTAARIPKLAQVQTSLKVKRRSIAVDADLLVSAFSNIYPIIYNLVFIVVVD